MDKTQLEELKNILIEEKEILEKELPEIAEKKDGEWETKRQEFGAREEDTAEETEEYVNDLAVETQLVSRLEDINEALVRIENNVYGLCEKCGNPIEIERLKVEPEAKKHVKCSE